MENLFFIWSESMKDLNEFHTFINSRMESIKFTLHYDLERISFLVVLVKNYSNCLQTVVYKKETDRNTFLQLSNHPLALKKSLPCSQLLRLRSICNSDESFDKDLCKKK